MKIRRKSNDCLNCAARLDSVYNYCPLCGQENTDNNVSFGKLITDFFSNYFALDSKFTHSIRPFFFKPGYLTNKFNIGKRMSYANPVRLYLIVSLFFFFIFSNVGKKVISNEGKDDDAVITTSTNKGKDNVSTSISGISEMTAKELEEMKEDLGIGLKPIMRTLPKKDKKKLIDKFGVETAAQYYITPKDTVIREKKIVSTDAADDFLSDNKFNWNLFNEELKKNKDISDQQVYDSIYIGKASKLEQLIAKQRIKVERTKMEYFVGYALKNLPIMMFLLLPIFALILKLLHIRRKVLYIRHLIHALHLHAFAYLIYGITILFTFYAIENEDVSDWINLFSFVLVSTYTYISFLKVYKQHWFKALIKFNIHGFLYASFLLLFFVCSMAISFILF